jgi:hypothetical protein
VNGRIHERLPGHLRRARGRAATVTVGQPNPDVRETGAEVDEFLDAPPRLPTTGADEPKGSPTPHPGEPDPRGDAAGAPDDPTDDEVEAGTAAPDVGS